MGIVCPLPSSGILQIYLFNIDIFASLYLINIYAERWTVFLSTQTGETHSLIQS